MAEVIQRCRFVTSQKTYHSYYCLSHENCCENGCCINSLRKMLQIWYFWAILIILPIFFLCGLHYYRKMQEERNLRLERNRRRHLQLLSARMARSHRNFCRRSENMPSQCMAREENIMADIHREPQINQFESLYQPGEINTFLVNQIIIRNLDFSISGDEMFLPEYTANEYSTPPDYNSVAKDTIYTDPPPHYNEACRLLEERKKELEQPSCNGDDPLADTHGTHQHESFPKPSENK